MEEKVDNIYIYLWEEFNTVYVGRSKNLKSRHYHHKHRESEKTYKFSSEHHVEHPPMIILETDLTIKEGVEREKYWIEYYRNTREYNVLNTTCGGQMGKLSKYTEEERKQRQKEYYQKNREKKLAYQKEYNKNHKEELKRFHDKYDKEYSKKWYEKNREKKLAYQKSHHKKVKD